MRRCRTSANAWLTSASQRWQQALASVCAYVGGYSASLFWHDAATRNAQALLLFNDDPNYTKLYFEKYVPMDPFFPASSFMEPGVVHGANDIIPQAELEQTRFYQEWIAPQGIADAIAVNLEKGVLRSSFLAIRICSARSRSAGCSTARRPRAKH